MMMMMDAFRVCVFSENSKKMNILLTMDDDDDDDDGTMII